MFHSEYPMTWSIPVNYVKQMRNKKTTKYTNV